MWNIASITMSDTSPQDMTKIDGSDCEYVEIFPHRIGSISTPSRGTALVGRTDAKQGKFPNITMRNTEVNNIYEGRAGFQTTIGLYEKKSIKVLSPHA
jgi:hypothetical protein